MEKLQWKQRIEAWKAKKQSCSSPILTVVLQILSSASVGYIGVAALRLLNGQSSCGDFFTEGIDGVTFYEATVVLFVGKMAYFVVSGLWKKVRPHKQAIELKEDSKDVLPTTM